jgi:hypothetical protein
MLISLNSLNQRAFLKVRNTLMDPENSVLVLDDELFGSRASDVETRTVSDRKAGKEGPVHDIVADSLLGTPFAMSLKVKGVSVTDNSDDVLCQIGRVTKPAVPTNRPHIGFDRGYGKLKMVEDSGSKGFGVITIATTHGSRHPFLGEEDLQKLEQRELANPTDWGTPQ